MWAKGKTPPWWYAEIQMMREGVLHPWTIAELTERQFQRWLVAKEVENAKPKRLKPHK